MSLVSLVEGSVFAGRYQIVRSIAQGGMGAVYEVVHTETQRRRALKVMLPNMLQSQEMRDRFRQEACVTANIESEHIVDVLDAGIDEKTQMPFLVMELLRGEELDKRLKRLGRLDAREVVTYLHHVALALDKTHRASIVHRDLKPGNVFLTEREDGSLRAKILDFGVAKLIADGATSAGATQSLGTPLYMAPEQFNIGQKVSPAVDIFSLGMMAYTLLVGAPYWQEEISAGANIYAFAARAMHGPTEAATARAIRQGVSLPAAFDAWFARVTASAPQARFPMASAAIAALAEALGVALGAERASSMSLPAIPPVAPQGADPRASSPSLSPSTPGSIGVGTPGPFAINDAGTIPLLPVPVPAELPARASPLPVAGSASSSPVEPNSMPAHVTTGGMATTAAPKGSPRKPMALVFAASALSIGLLGAAVFFLRGGAAPASSPGSEEAKGEVDAPTPPAPTSVVPETGAAKVEAAEQPSSLPIPIISPEPTSAPEAIGSTSPIASPSAAPNTAPSTVPEAVSGKGKGATTTTTATTTTAQEPSFGGSKAPATTVKKTPGIARD